MTNEEFQKLVMEQLTELGKGQRELQHSIIKIENEQIPRLQHSIARIETERLPVLQNAITKIENERLPALHNSITKIENEQGEKITALFDAREVQLDVNQRILEALTRIENKVDKVSLKVAAHDAVIRRAR
ncbi:MAG: hypothetical protein LLG02_03145 [Pelosinus sp.]|nr:hypothetical protein [Pelosinus sp.]